MNSDQDLDHALAASRPEVRPDSQRVERARRKALEARQVRPWPRRVALAAVATGTVLGMGAAAAATVGLPFIGPGGGVSNTQTISNGDRCYQEVWITPAGAADPQALVVAETALRTLDLSKLDLQDGLEAQHDYEWAGDGPQPHHSYLRDSLDAKESVALQMAISQAVSSALTKQGYDATTVAVESDSTCDDQPKG